MLIGKRLSVRGWAVGNAQDCEETLAFAQKHGIRCMIEKFSLDQAPQAYARRTTARFRPVIVPGL